MFEKQEFTLDVADNRAAIERAMADMTPERRERFTQLLEQAAALVQIDELRRAVMKGER